MGVSLRTKARLRKQSAEIKRLSPRIVQGPNPGEWEIEGVLGSVMKDMITKQLAEFRKEIACMLNTVTQAVHAPDVLHFPTGAKRGTELKLRFDLLNEVAERRLAATQAEGAHKYGDNNYRKGMPAHDLLNHAMAHINAYRAGNTSEDDLAHAVWNLCTLMFVEEKLPELMDIANRS